jgi:hypothetical protein
MAPTQFRLATALCAISVVTILAKSNKEKDKEVREAFENSLKPKKVEVGDVSYEEYSDRVCFGTKYTHDAKNVACNGWGDETWQQCVKHCSNNDIPKACKAKHAKCGAAVFYPNVASKDKTGWCHLFEKDQCEKTEFWSPLKIFKKAAAPETEIADKWEVMSDKVTFEGSTAFSYPAAFAMLAMFAAVIFGVFLFRRRSAQGMDLVPSLSDAEEGAK